MTVDHSQEVSAPMRDAIEAADPATLLLSLVHATGDVSLLDRFGPSFERVVRYSRPTIEASPEAAREIRDLALQVLPGIDEPAIHVPDEALFKKMASFVTLEDTLSDQYVPYLLEMCGFEWARPEFDESVPNDLKVIIIGGGMSGMATAIRLGRAGIDWQLFEAAGDFGGTWYRTNYPGVAVDTPSHFYSFSFELNPKWTRYYPQSTEYQRYMLDVAEKYKLYDNTSFRTKVNTCTWDEEAAEWVVEVVDADGNTATHRANAVVSALGYLNTPKRPNIPGEEKFTGRIMHSAEWDETVDLAGKKVAVVGTGATAIQLVAELTPQVGQMTVVQRQPHWVFKNAAVGESVPEAQRWALEHIPYYHQWYRVKIHWFAGDINVHMVTVDPEWVKNNPHSISEANELRRQAGLQYLEESFADRPDLKAQLTPDYPPFGKRPVMDPGFFDALKQPHVKMVTGGMKEYTENGLLLDTGIEVEADVIVLATGYNLLWHSSVEVIGRDGVSLNQVWENGENPFAHRGQMVPGFPNFFNLAGPNEGSNHGGGHNVNAEVDAQFVTASMQWLQQQDAAAMEPTQEAFEAFDAELQKQLATKIWMFPSTATTYYTNKAGRVILPYPGLMVERWTEQRKPIPSEYRLTPRKAD